MKHAHRINMDFVYVPSRLTDVSKTFARIRKQRAEEARALAESRKTVFQIKKLRGAAR